MKRILMWAMLIATCMAGAGGMNRAEAQGYVIVVNAGSNVSTMSKRELSDVFLKKSGSLVPVDLSKDTRTRDAFSQGVLGRSASAVAAYWQQQIFAGRDVPPVEKASDAEVLAFVRSNPNAIGYVSANAALGDGVKTVPIKS